VTFAIYIRFIPSVIKVNMTQYSYVSVYNVHPLANNWDIAAKLSKGETKINKFEFLKRKQRLKL